MKNDLFVLAAGAATDAAHRRRLVFASRPSDLRVWFYGGTGTSLPVNLLTRKTGCTVTMSRGG